MDQHLPDIACGGSDVGKRKSRLVKDDMRSGCKM